MLFDSRRVFSPGNLAKLFLLIVLVFTLSSFFGPSQYVPNIPFRHAIDNNSQGNDEDAFGSSYDSSSISSDTSPHSPQTTSSTEGFIHHGTTYTPPKDPFVDSEAPVDKPSDMPEEESTESWTQVTDNGFGDDDGYPLPSGNHDHLADVDPHGEDEPQPAHNAFTSSCPEYIRHSEQRHEPFSTGRYSLSYQRPDQSCRTFTSKGVDELISRYRDLIKDPDLYRLFENSFPNTLDTAIRWKGRSADTDEELTFIITGDIDAMWLRDSANQLQSYRSLLNASDSEHSLASLYRGVINLQARYLLQSPYCNSFQPPPESGIPPAINGASVTDHVNPKYDNQTVYECKYEIDSLAAFLQISHDYYIATDDWKFFRDNSWAQAVNDILDLAEGMMAGTYSQDGEYIRAPYTFLRHTWTAADALTNGGNGSPVIAGTGLIRSDFRPSDDAVIYQLFIPGNMMFARYLESASRIMDRIAGRTALAKRMHDLAGNLRAAITKHGIVHDATYGDVYAYEIDGFGSVNMMDDANIPSLLAAPMFGYLDAADPIYQNTRKKVLSDTNPYFMRGPIINAVGGPHDGPGKAWPMASIVRILTSDDDREIYAALKEIISSTAGLGLIHESINTFNELIFTRQWFSWANGLFGQMIIDLEKRKPDILRMSFQ